MTTKSVTVQWEKTNLTALKEWDGTGKAGLRDPHFYAFSRGKNLLYIGMAYKLDVDEEARAIIKDNKIGSTGLTIWIGRIIETDYGRVTIQIVKDVKALLIYIEQPPYNTQFTKSYGGRDGIMVKNRRCPVLRPCVRAENGKTLKSCS